MDRVDFWALQRSIQERFMASTEGSAAPAPLAIHPSARDSRQLGWLLLGAAGLLGALLSLRVGFGDLRSPYALTPLRFAAVQVGLFALSALGFLKAAARHVTAHAVPYRPALYLFPIGVIDARTPRFFVHRLNERTEAHADRSNGCLRVKLDGVRFDFPTSDWVRAELTARELVELRDRLANAGPDWTAREQALLDPLLDNGFKNPFSPSESFANTPPSWVKVWPVLALTLGVLLGVTAWRVRNRLSEARLYAAARAADSSSAYRAYLARGGQNPDVQGLLLPRSELKDVVRQGTVSAIEAFGNAHPGFKIKPEIDAALRAALLKELALAESIGTLGALKGFAARYERYSFLSSDLDRAIDLRIETTLRQLRPSLAPNQARLLPFMERLLRYTAKHGPKVLVRFQRKPSETLDKAQNALRKSAYFSGENSLPGPYFEPARAEPREAAVASALSIALSAHFPPDLVLPELAPALAAEDSERAAAPTLLITYHTELSGAFISRRPRLALSGIGLITRTTFEIPQDPEPLTFKLSVWRAPDLKTIADRTTAEDLYNTMSTEAFKRYVKKYLATLFAER